MRRDLREYENCLPGAERVRLGGDHGAPGSGKDAGEEG